MVVLPPAPVAGRPTEDALRTEANTPQDAFRAFVTGRDTSMDPVERHSAETVASYQPNGFGPEAVPPVPSSQPVADLGTPFETRPVDEADLADDLSGLPREDCERDPAAAPLVGENAPDELASVLPTDTTRQIAGDHAIPQKPAEGHRVRRAEGAKEDPSPSKQGVDHRPTRTGRNNAFAPTVGSRWHPRTRPSETKPSLAAENP